MPSVSFKKRLLFESLFNSAGVGIAFVNEEGVPVRVNTKLCVLLGYSEDELLKTSFKDFTHPEDVEKDLDLFLKLLLGSIDSYEIEKRYIKSEGTVFWGLLTVSILRQDDGAAIVMAMVQDIDARKNAEAALLKSEERLTQHNIYKDKLFSIIAHDLRGPIGSTAKLLDFIEKNSSSLPKEKVIELVSMLRANATKTSELLDNLLSWSQAQFKEVRFEPAILSLPKEAEKVIGQLQQQAYDKGISLQTDVSSGLKVHADRHMLQVILRNLLSNAIKFSDSGKAVSVSAVEASSFIYISVTDEGVGLSDECVANLLNKNNEGVTSYGTKGEKGTGLGISLCINYIERHGGRLQISSEVSKGSRFTFSLPAAITIPHPVLLHSLSRP